MPPHPVQPVAGASTVVGGEGGGSEIDPSLERGEPPDPLPSRSAAGLGAPFRAHRPLDAARGHHLAGAGVSESRSAPLCRCPPPSLSKANRTPAQTWLAARSRNSSVSPSPGHGKRRLPTPSGLESPLRTLSPCAYLPTCQTTRTKLPAAREPMPPQRLPSGARANAHLPIQSPARTPPAPSQRPVAPKNHPVLPLPPLGVIPQVAPPRPWTTRTIGASGGQ